MPRKELISIPMDRLIVALSIVIVMVILPQSVNGYSLCTTTQSNCLICPIQCTICNSTFQCTSCAQQYYLSSNNSCLSCPQFCITCSSSTTCTTCKTPYVLVNDTCSHCLVANALTCNTTSTAQTCAAQYYVNSNYCSSCLLNCKTCTSSSTCTQCISTFYLNTTVLTCNPCPTNCLSCNQTTPSTCTSCASGYALVSGSCVSIDCSLLTNCFYCSSTNICGQCSMFYYWTGSQCIQGASVLCQYGSIGPLPSQCINSCPSSSYQSQSSSPFLCIPYRTTTYSSSDTLTQLYYNAFADVNDFNSLSSQSISSGQLQSTTGEYSYTLSMMNFSSLDSFYKVEIRLKYISTATITMQLSSQSQSSTQVQTQSTSLNAISSQPISMTYSSKIVHSNNLLITFSSAIRVIEVFVKLYRCASNCLQCLNLQLCQLCIQPLYMLNYQCVSNCTVYYQFSPNRTCLLDCPSGYYYATNGTNNNYCQACVSPCVSCISSTQCLSCINGYYFYNYACTTTCPNGYFPEVNGNICDNCISPCNNCVDKTTCLSCKIGYWNGVNCTIVCPNGYFGNNVTNNCDLCDTSCLTCSNSSTSCTSCKSPLYLQNMQCLTQCPARYYPTLIAPLTCLPCKPPCQSCSTLTFCTTCAYNYLYNGTCITSCPIGYFPNLLTNQCTLCSTSCKTCSSLTSCSSCYNSSCLYQGQCISNCPSQEWYKVLNSTSSECVCQSCQYPCKQCTAISTCLSCLTGYLQNSQCLTQCPTGYYGNDTSRVCTRCNATFSNCNQCTQTTCKLCQNNYQLYLGTCLSQCPQYYYSFNSQCSKCIAPCLECTGFSTCTTCTTGYVFYLNQCVISCPLGQYSFAIVKNSVNLYICGACQSPCLYCTNKATTCTFCESSYYLYNNSCYLNCSTITPLSTFYDEPVTSTCAKCLFPCKTCSSQDKCKSCMIGYLNSVDQKCAQCSAGTYPNNTAGVCVACPQQCVICYDKDYCTSCNAGYYLFQNQCINNLTICQINGYYGIGRVCVLCQQPCKTCTGAATNCTSCLQGYVFFGNKCLVQCPTGYFSNSTTSQCDPCSTNCTSCVGSNSYCFSCSTGYNLYSSTMKCLDQCPNYTYTESSFCTACQYPCLECTSSSYCLSCITGSFTAGQCLSSCSSGYFTNNLGACQACDPSCSQCSTTSTNCTQCPSGTYLYNSSCVISCPSTYFAESQSQQCISCMGTCYQCQSNSNCTSCSNSLYFYISQSTNQGQCAASCPNGYYPSSGANLCVACRSDCLTCTNSNACLLCNNGKVMYNGDCYAQCPSKMYSYQGVCQDCKQPCYNCTDTTTCTSCINSTYLLVGNAQCMQGPMCPVGYFLLQNSSSCNSQCPSGDYYITQNRTCNSKGCGNDYFRGQDYYCYEQCPNGFIADQQGQCQSCAGSQCLDGLFFSLKYAIQYDQLLVTVIFTQTPRYLSDGPSFVITPNTEYAIKSYSSIRPNQNNSLVQTSSTTYKNGSQKIIFNLNPSTSLQQMYFSVKFQNSLETFQNPLQNPYSTFYLQGYDKYNTQELKDFSSLGILALICALIGLIKNPYMTDFGQLLWILALNNVHYPFNLRSFLQGTKIASFYGFLSITQPNMQGNGKFAYVVNDGLLQNAFGNIIIIIIGLCIAGMGFAILRFLEWFLQYRSLHSGSVAPNQQQFIPNNLNHQHPSSPTLNEAQNKNSQTSLQQSNIPKSIIVKNFLSKIYTFQNFKILYMNRFIYYNYLPISLFTFTQLSNLDTSQSINVIGFALSFFTIFMVVVYPFALLKDKPRYTFLYIRKIVVALSLILSVNYPAYCIGVLSVTNITAILLIQSYKLEKWRLERQFNALGEGLQLILMILYAVFIMIGEGNQTSFKQSFSYLIIFITLGILLYYILFSLFLFVLWVILRLLEKDYIAEWIENAKKEESDSADSETMNDSMKDHQEKKMTAEQNQQQNKWDHIEQMLKNNKGDDQNFIQGQIQDFIQTRPFDIMPKDQSEQDTGNALFWKYETHSEEDHNKEDKQPPKMLIRCVNEFSDFDQKEKQQQSKHDDYQ